MSIGGICVSRSFFVRVCMFTVSNALLMSSATAMVRAGGGRSEGCSLHVVALLDSIWIDKLHRLSLPTAKWAQLPFLGPAGHWNLPSHHHLLHHKQSVGLKAINCQQWKDIMNALKLPPETFRQNKWKY